MSNELSEKELDNLSKEINDDFSELNVSSKYVTSQTGIDSDDLRTFINLVKGECDRALEDEEYLDIYKRFKEFYNLESTNGKYTKLDNELFFGIHEKLREIIKLSNRVQVKMINDKMKEIHKRFYLEESDERISFDEYLMTVYSSNELEEKGKIRSVINDKIKELEIIEDFGLNVNGIDECGETVPISTINTPEEESELLLRCEKLKQEIETLLKKINEYNEKDKKHFENYTRMYKNISPYKYSCRRNRPEIKIERHYFNKPSNFSTDQQRAILEAYFDKCTDKEGYLLPDYFGTGVKLLNYIDEVPIRITTGFWKFKYIKRAEPWIKNSEFKKYDWGEKLPGINKNDYVYKLILMHKKTFFSDASIENTRIIVRHIKYSPPEIRKKIFNYLNNEYSIIIPKSNKAFEYYKALAEYYDLFSMLPATKNADKYSLGQIYRALYEIAAQSGGELVFSNEMVEQANSFINKFNDKHWILHIYVFNYVYKHKSIDTLINFIEEENDKWYDERELE